MTITAHKNRSGDRLILEEDGYSEHYRAYIQGCRTYKVSLPIDLIAAWGYDVNDELHMATVAQSILEADAVDGGKVIRRGIIQ
jgi:hypothetical protein